MILQANQIIVPRISEIRNLHILGVYFNIFKNGHGDDLPPCVITHKDKIERGALGNYADKDKIRSIYEKLENSKAKYLLLDGNHKSVAGTLCHHPVNYFELCSNRDLETLSVMAERGEIFNFPHNEDSITKIANKFIDYTFDSTPTENILTLQDMVDSLVSNKILPQYMIDRHRQNIY